MPTRFPNSAHHKRRRERSESATAAPAANSNITISERGIQRLKNGHVWVYRSDVVSADGVAPGAVVQVKDPRGHHLGSALYSSSSQIAVRMLSSGVAEDFPALLRERIRQSIAYRQELVRDTNAYRVIFSEGDFLPGLIVDRYNEILSVQILTQAMDSEAARSALVGELSERLRP